MSESTTDDGPFDRRLRRARERLTAVGADLLVLSPGANLTYLTGVAETPSERHFLLFVPARGPTTFVVPELAASQVRSAPVDDVRTWADGEDPTAAIEAVLDDQAGRRGRDLDRLLLDDRMWATFVTDLRSLRPSASMGLASAALEPLRLRKDPTEVATLRRAGALADRVSETIRARGADVVGLTERELAREIDRLLVEEGGIEPAFDTVVAAGPNGAKPHHHPGDRVIGPGDPVVLDFGAFVPAEMAGGSSAYPGDQTRTVVFDGDPSETFRMVHEVVRRAQEAAVDAIEPGVTASEVDRVARERIEAAGYGDAFTHRTGHGVGLEVHEPPSLAPGEDRPLEPGTVVSVEPGIYLDGEFGVRIEDLVVVTDDGAERLNDSPRGWRAGGHE